MDTVERIYFSERFVKHGDRNELKRAFLKKYEITGRQLNGVIFNLSGKAEATSKAFCGIWASLLRDSEVNLRSLDLCISAMKRPSNRLVSPFVQHSARKMVKGQQMNGDITYLNI